MNTEQILALYDKEMRQEVEYPDSRREVTPIVVRPVNLFTPIGFQWLNTIYPCKWQPSTLPHAVG